VSRGVARALALLLLAGALPARAGGLLPGPWPAPGGLSPACTQALGQRWDALDAQRRALEQEAAAHLARCGQDAAPAGGCARERAGLEPRVQAYLEANEDFARVGDAALAASQATRRLARSEARLAALRGAAPAPEDPAGRLAAERELESLRAAAKKTLEANRDALAGLTCP
jgi:hypothetical protein